MYSRLTLNVAALTVARPSTLQYFYGVDDTVDGRACLREYRGRGLAYVGGRSCQSVPVHVLILVNTYPKL